MNFVSQVMPLIGGYWFLTIWNRTRFTVYKESGYHLLFKTVLAGIVFLFIAKIFLTLLGDFDLQGFIPTELSLDGAMAMILGIVSPYVLNCFSNFFPDQFSNRDEHARIAVERHGNLLYLTINEAIKRVELVELTMKAGKVYIGYPLKFSSLENDFIDLIPYASGFRSVETKELEITSKYWMVFADLAHQEKNTKMQARISNIKINIKVEEIVSARIFYPEIYAKFERIRNKENM